MHVIQELYPDLQNDLFHFWKNLKMITMSQVFNADKCRRRKYSMYDLNLDYVFEKFREPIVKDVLLRKDSLGKFGLLHITERNYRNTTSPFLTIMILNGEFPYNFYDPEVSFTRLLRYIKQDEQLSKTLYKLNVCYRAAKEFRNWNYVENDLAVGLVCNPRYYRELADAFRRYNMNMAYISIDEDVTDVAISLGSEAVNIVCEEDNDGGSDS